MFKACALTAGGMLVFSLACGADKGGTGNDPFKNGTGGNFGSGGSYFADTSKPSTGGNGSGNGGSGADDDSCGQKNFDLQRLPPEVIVVQDKSGSMQEDASGDANGNPKKWAETTGALSTVFRATEGEVHWGLQLYPTCTWTGNGLECEPSPCTIEGGAIAPAVDQADELNMMISQNAPRLHTGATPTTEAVEIATAALMGRNTPNPKFLLLSTDGKPNCRNHDGGLTGGGDDDADGAVAAVRAAVNAGIDVFVVGLATQNNAHDVLNRMADAGGRALQGNTRYYSVNNQSELSAALTNIAGIVQDCTFPLGQAPPPGSTVVVEIDGTHLAPGDWNYGAGSTSIVVSGEWCDKLKNGEAQNAAIKYRCDGRPIE